MPTIFLIDLDKTLINHNYQPTIDITLFRKLIKSLVDRGDVFALCSDSALDTLLYWRKFFRFNGPIIYENGMGIEWQDGKRQLTLSPPFNGILLKNELKQRIKQLFPDAQVIEENYLSVIHRPTRFSAKQLIIFNPYRQYSISLHALVLNKRQYLYDAVLAQDVADYLQDFIYDEGLEDKIKLDTNLAYAINILKSPYINKTLALPFIKQKYPGYQLIVIGDGLQESLMAGLVDELWAVNNACSQLKQVADKAAKLDITQGVYQLLMDYLKEVRS